MMKQLVILLLVLTTTLQGALWQNTGTDIAVNNRVLAKINGKIFSVIDLMKKMELVFYREYPQYAESNEAKLYFFKNQWKHVLDELVDEELILANSKEVNFIVPDGDVRQEIESLFGPNVVTNIDKLGMSYEEVFKMLANDLTVQRMVYSMAQINALNRVGPQEIKKAFELYAKENPIEEKWVYRIITLKSGTKEGMEPAIKLIQSLVEEKMVTFDTLTAFIEEKELLPKELSVSVSETFEREAKTISTVHKEILTPLAVQTFSAPIQSQKKEGDVSSRLFFLEAYTPAGTPSFSEMELVLKNRLLDKAMREESIAYRKKLRKKFGIAEDFLTGKLPEQFEPFVLIPHS